MTSAEQRSARLEERRQRRVAGQGALLIAGFLAAHGLSLLRNACIGWALSRGDFGIAASVTLVLQVIEVATDLGPDRLLLHAHPDHERQLLATAHAVALVRGLVLSAVLLAIAAPMATFFGVPEARHTFAWAALVPVIRGFVNLDYRIRQRRLDNASFLTIEVASQALAAAIAWPLLMAWPTPATVVGLVIVQAAAATATSHVLARLPYRLHLTRRELSGVMSFSWPLWLSALPLLAVTYADRIVIGRWYGMVALAGFAAGTMLAMLPGLLVARAANALLTPLIADQQGEAPRRQLVCTAMEIAVVLAAAYAVLFALAGGPILGIVFGPGYVGLDRLMLMLAAMFAVRMIQSVPGVVLMSLRHTRPLLWAGIARALPLPLTVVLAMQGAAIEWIVVVGIAGEILSLLTIAAALERQCVGLGRACLRRGLLTCALVAVLAVLPLPRLDAAAAIALALAGIAASTLLHLAFLPTLRAYCESRLARARSHHTERKPIPVDA